MKTTRTLAGLFAFSIAAATSMPALAQETTRTVEQHTCKDILRDSGDARDVSIAFLHGYLLGKSGASEFDVAVMGQQSDAFIEYCLDNPDAVAAEALMMQQE